MFHPVPGRAGPRERVAEKAGYNTRAPRHPGTGGRGCSDDANCRSFYVPHGRWSRIDLTSASVCIHYVAGGTLPRKLATDRLHASAKPARASLRCSARAPEDRIARSSRKLSGALIEDSSLGLVFSDELLSLPTDLWGPEAPRRSTRRYGSRGCTGAAAGRGGVGPTTSALRGGRVRASAAALTFWSCGSGRQDLIHGPAQGRVIEEGRGYGCPSSRGVAGLVHGRHFSSQYAGAGAHRLHEDVVAFSG